MSEHTFATILLLTLIGALTLATVVCLIVACLRRDDVDPDGPIPYALAHPTHVEADALWESDEWGRHVAAVEACRAGIDAIPDSVTAHRLIAHPRGLVLAIPVRIDLTDLQRAETPADIWRDA